jgi:hypothetical protein
VKPWDERWLFVRPVRGFLEKKRDNVTRKIKEKPGTLLTPTVSFGKNFRWAISAPMKKSRQKITDA